MLLQTIAYYILVMKMKLTECLCFMQNEMIQKPDRSISDMFFRLKGIYCYIVRRY